MTVATAGTAHRLLAVEIFSGELSCDDYELFLLEMIDSLKASGVAVLTWVQDNAKWYLLHTTRGRLAGVKIVNTVPHFFQTNLLELILSSVLRLFSKRLLCAAEEEELRQIVSCFERSNTERVVTAARYKMAHYIGLLLSKAVESVKRI